MDVFTALEQEEAQVLEGYTVITTVVLKRIVSRWQFNGETAREGGRNGGEEYIIMRS